MNKDKNICNKKKKRKKGAQVYVSKTKSVIQQFAYAPTLKKKKTFNKFDRLNITFRLTFGQGKTN